MGIKGKESCAETNLSFLQVRPVSDGDDSLMTASLDLASSSSMMSRPRSEAVPASTDNAVPDGSGGGGAIELMEIPLSPTHYDQPDPPPDHPPPSALQAEAEITRVLGMLRTVSL